MMKKIIIAIDGLSSCGKSTMAKDLAQHIGYIYVDTGAMYRCVTLWALRHGLYEKGVLDEAKLSASIKEIEIGFTLNKFNKKPEAILDKEIVEKEIRTMEVSQKVSYVSSLPFVRSNLVEKQRQMGKNKGVVMDGRDIGTTVFPNAELKIYVTANAKVRAQRRYSELKEKGIEANFDTILHNILCRDKADSSRTISPLVKADDAIELDNSYMTIEEQREWLLDKFLNVVKEL